MSALIKKHVSFFRVLLTTTSKLQRKVLLDTITHDQLKALTEITHNILKGNLPITSVQKKLLKRHVKLYLLIGDPKRSDKSKRKALCRQGQAIVTLLKSTEASLKHFL
ncbi:hypothetical protein BOW09_12325 [Solemya velum gill symbiont]|nr:hypothetical protein BOW09_12325 [Solemya velum gill symbiont]